MKLARTHLTHMAGNGTLSSKSSRFSIRRFREAFRFRKIFEKTPGRVTDSFASEKATPPVSVNFSRGQLPIHVNQPYQRVPPRNPGAEPELLKICRYQKNRGLLRGLDI